MPHNKPAQVAGSHPQRERWITAAERRGRNVGNAHVLVSIVLGATIIVVGLQFRSTVQSAQDTIIGCVLILTGLGFAVMELTGHGHIHDLNITTTSITTTRHRPSHRGSAGFAAWPP